MTSVGDRASRGRKLRRERKTACGRPEIDSPGCRVSECRCYPPTNRAYVTRSEHLATIVRRPKDSLVTRDVATSTDLAERRRKRVYLRAGDLCLAKNVESAGGSAFARSAAKYEKSRARQRTFPCAIFTRSHNVKIASSVTPGRVRESEKYYSCFVRATACRRGDHARVSSIK